MRQYQKTLLLTLIVLMSAFDGLATWFEMAEGVCSELNPAMAYLYHAAEIWAVLVKIAVTTAGVSVLLWAYSGGRKACLWIVLGALAGYAALTTWHISIIWG